MRNSARPGQRRAKSRRGITLVMVAGVLTILAAVGTSFYSLMLMQTKSATRYSDAVRAEMLAHAGVADAVARMRDLLYKSPEDPAAPWFSVDYLQGARKGISFPYVPETSPVGPDKASYTKAMGNTVGTQSDRYAIRIEDAASKININAGDNLGPILDNLCRLIGPPLVAADFEFLQPRRWVEEGADVALFGKNTDDKKENLDLYYICVDNGGKADPVNGRPRLHPDGSGRSLYGDGYAIAAYRSNKGKFRDLADVKNALTYVKQNTGDKSRDRELEDLEREVKFNMLKEHITVDSWVDRTTVGVGKFEWIGDTSIDGQYYQLLIDRDKSWVADDPKNDPLNQRGSLRGCYLSVLNGHGGGQLRRVATNGIDWVAVRSEEPLIVEPGPITSYMLIAPEDAVLESLDGAEFKDFPEKLPTDGKIYLPKLEPDGSFTDNPKIDHDRFPLCIHRAPININTASDKVLAALFMNLNVQHGHYMAVGTDADAQKTLSAWYRKDPHGIEPRLPTFKGLKRLPEQAGKPIFDRPMPMSPGEMGYDFGYLNNYGAADPSGSDKINEALELAWRIIVARQKDTKNAYVDALTGKPTAGKGATSFERRPFRSWDDVFFRVVKPWDEARMREGWVDKDGDGVMSGDDEYKKASVARLVMCNVNPNTDLLKFNPNIEWIDRWGRNFTEMEPVMIFTNQAEPHASNPPVADVITNASIPIFSTADPMLKSSQRDAAGNFIKGAYITRNYRYKADELIDKSDLNRSSTELSFDSNGIYNIISTGQVLSRGELRAERKLEALVKVYDVWRESTQRQFAQGLISKATGKPGSHNSGQLTRDSQNEEDRLALVTLPEPLQPLRYTIRDQNGQPNPKNREVVDSSIAGTQKRNAFGIAVDINMPDVVANRILPAGYDGQIALATNTSAYDTTGDADTFLASFDGDLDTATAQGNGHEQAKVPHIDKGRLNGEDLKGKGHYLRVVDTCGLLGVLNDIVIDMDPGLPPVDPGDAINGYRWVYRFQGVNAGLKPLVHERTGGELPYYNNVTCRMGDLRSDGAYLSAPGVGGNDATLKYLYGDTKDNFKPDSQDGNTVTVWAKTTWHGNDFRHHEFFNASNPATHVHNASGCYIAKYGQYSYVLGDGPEHPTWGHTAHRTKCNDLVAFWEYNAQQDLDCGGLLHGGYAYVPATKREESPSFRVQPFRWSFVGMRRNYYSNVNVPRGDGPTGHWVDNGLGSDWEDTKSVNTVKYHVRPFIDSQLHPEGKSTWEAKQFWCFRSNGSVGGSTPGNQGNTGALNGNGTTGQDVKWQWADPPGPNQLKVFTVNNLNFGSLNKINDPSQVYAHYRFMPDDGTYAVIDELKLSNRDRVMRDNAEWEKDRVVREQATSRYYMPPTPNGKDPAAGGSPTFTSQSMLQSIRGQTKSGADERITVVRVSWNVFTPRFMHEYQKVEDSPYKRTERLTYDKANQQNVKMKYRGPFDYATYNDDSYIEDANDDGNGRVLSHISVNRPAPEAYGVQQPHGSRGVEVELVQDQYAVPSGGKILGTYINPDEVNPVGSPNAPVSVNTKELRYRVRFLYPVDPLADPNGGNTVNPGIHMMLDTPVFDDISVTYFTRPKVLYLREVSE